MGRLLTRARTDATSTEIQASVAYLAAPTWRWSSTLDMRDFTHLALFFDPIVIAGVTVVEIVLAWSDDGTTIPFTDENYQQQSDFNLPTFTDGSFNPKTYTARLATADGSLVANEGKHFVFPVNGGFCRIGVRGNTTNGSYALRAQRLVS